MNRYLFVLLLSAVALVFGQTRISARKQARDFDLSEAANVRPIPVVSNLPSTCVQGEMVFKANAEAGRNLYACTGGNTWAAQSTTSATDPGFRVSPNFFDFRKQREKGCAVLRLAGKCSKRIDVPCTRITSDEIVKSCLHQRP